jgi:hypothetical protein
MGLADNRKKHSKRYMEWVKGIILDGEWELIRQPLLSGQLTGSARFVEEIDHKIERGWSSDGREGRGNPINKSVPFFFFSPFFSQ